MTFLFDIGNVLLHLHFDRFYAAVLGRADATLPEALVGLKDPYESGVIDDAQFVARCLDALSRPLSPKEFTAAWGDIFSLNYDMSPIVSQLRAQGHRLILFSNTNGLHSDHFLKEFEVFRCFHDHHFSHEVKSMKPSPNFYRTAIERFDLTPETTIYIDDLAENIAAGRTFGFSCWQYRVDEHAACVRWLSQQGVYVDG